MAAAVVRSPASMSEPPVSLDERRARIRRWSSSRPLRDIVGGASQGGVHCAVCEKPIEAGEADFIITFNDAATLRLDQACIDLWREETQEPPSTS